MLGRLSQRRSWHFRKGGTQGNVVASWCDRSRSHGCRRHRLGHVRGAVMGHEQGIELIPKYPLHKQPIGHCTLGRSFLDSMYASDAFAIIAVVIVLLSTAILLSRRMQGKNISLWLAGAVLAVFMAAAGVVWAIWR
jgi:hypothetical protein